jgi:hypothetical protein
LITSNDRYLHWWVILAYNGIFIVPSSYKWDFVLDTLECSTMKICLLKMYKEHFEDTKWVIRSHKLKKDRQRNGQNKRCCVKGGWLFVWCISFYNGIFLTFFYVINLPVLWVQQGERSRDLSNNYNHTLPVFNSLDRIYNANFPETYIYVL